MKADRDDQNLGRRINRTPLFDHNFGSRNFHNLEELKIYLSASGVHQLFFGALTASTRGWTVSTKDRNAAQVENINGRAINPGRLVCAESVARFFVFVLASL